MRSELHLPPIPGLPRDPSKLIEGAISFLHTGDGSGPSYLALGEADTVRAEGPGRAFEQLKAFLARNPDWAFGHFSYELKDELEELQSDHPDPIAFPSLHFFVPKVLFILEKERTKALYLPSQLTSKEVKELHTYLAKGNEAPSPEKGFRFKERLVREDYLDRVHALKEHIQQGDIYEANFCQEFYHPDAPLSPYDTFTKLQSLAGAPMGGFYRVDGSYLLSASPERFLRFSDGKVIAQPMKGTAPRGKDKEEDIRLAERLSQDPKERAENVMIVDLMRNDLSRTAAKGSVNVEELCGVHPFPTVHQMISTISSRIGEGYHPSDVIGNAFPMGSMTGAPKVRAMELIESYEGMHRGLYSGSIGYFDPEGNGDFNVVIRSLLYNARSHYLSGKVGGAITARSDPEKEYEECLLKAEALKRTIA